MGNGRSGSGALRAADDLIPTPDKSPSRTNTGLVPQVFGNGVIQDLSEQWQNGGLTVVRGCSFLSRVVQLRLRITQLYKGSSQSGDFGSYSPSESGMSYSQRRKMPRYTFIATTEQADAASAVRFSGRVTEISRDGCYVDSFKSESLTRRLTPRSFCSWQAKEIWWSLSD